jgi:xylose isomerase
MKEIKYSAGLWVFGTVPNRYLPEGHQKNTSFTEKLEAIKDTKVVSAIELPYGPVLKKDNAEKIFGQLNEFGLSASSLTVNVTGDSKWNKGSISSPDKSIREQAIEDISNAMVIADKYNVSTINLWMGQDGFDYPFECDYNELWSYMVEGLRACAKAAPKVNLCVEYKIMEPKARNLPNSAAQAILMTDEAKEDNLGVTIDFGHAIMGKENPSQSLLLAKRHNKHTHIHINDNYGDWDWDMAAGYNHWWQLIEFFYWLDKTDFDDYIVLDVFPYRQDPKRITQVSLKAMNKAKSIADRLKKKRIDDFITQRNAIEIFDLLFE